MSEPQEKIPISDLKDAFLECPVCVEHFNQTDRLPRLLHSCLHAFCTQCLHQLLQKEGNNQVTCPLCRQVQKVSGRVDSLPKDPVREQLVEYLQITHRREVLCKDCPDNNTAKSRCMECGENFCQECENAHKRNRSTRSHRVVPFEELENETNGTLKVRHFCTSHPDRLIECFCSNCEIICCLLCAVIDHKGHDFKKLDDAAGLKIEELESLMTKVKKVSDKLKTAKSDCDVYVTGILEDKEKSVSEINKSYEAIANLLRKRQSFLLREVEERSERLVAFAKKSACLYDDSLAEIQSTETYFFNAKSKTDEVSILQMFPSLKKTLSNISSNNSDEIKEFTQKIVFEASEEENVQKYVSAFGDVKEINVEDSSQQQSGSTFGPHDDLLEFKGSQGKKEFKGSQGKKEFGGSQGKKEFGGSHDQEEFRGFYEEQSYGHSSQQQSGSTFGPHDDLLEFKGSQGKKEFKGSQGKKEFGGSQGKKEFGGSHDQEEFRGFYEEQSYGHSSQQQSGSTFGPHDDLLEFKGSQGKKEFKGSQGKKEFGGSQGKKEFGGSHDQEEFRGFYEEQSYGPRQEEVAAIGMQSIEGAPGKKSRSSRPQLRTSEKTKKNTGYYYQEPVDLMPFSPHKQTEKQHSQQIVPPPFHPTSTTQEEVAVIGMQSCEGATGMKSRSSRWSGKDKKNTGYSSRGGYWNNQ